MRVTNTRSGFDGGATGDFCMTFVYRWLTVLHITFLLFLTYLADSGKGMRLWLAVERIPYGDKIGHLLLMGLLAFLVNMSLRCERIKLLSVLKGSAIVWVLVTLEEWSQLLFSRRSFSLQDLAADYIGIILFGQLALWVFNRSERKNSPIGMSTTSSAE